MALIDEIFGSIPEALLTDWGRDITYIKTTSTYNSNTGSITRTDTNVTVRAFISSVNVSESEGLFQSTDLKVVFGNKELGDYYPSQADRIRYTQAGENREAKIIEVKTQRGDKPVMHSIIARPQ